ncbi:NUDIX domain-containing protein [Sphingomonas sp. So64.6b]|uniref:NUDIX hydrolase n=1 Tax=Sphingomonas sp. So64.6b TaxID=2997354 RepID=UPI0016008E20|nr:NUDIX domain-containing protein [Sphingomonas sp. So64.6b]QNA86255.1 NUDIX domain-containing protein [Sphingomonas sp. So64.6b]
MSALAERPAARILLTDDQNRVLLFRFDAGDRPPFWATPGGAIDPGESFAGAARRELREETGLDLDCGEEVHRRTVTFTTLEDVPVIAEERYFRVHAGACTIDTGGHTELERRVMQQHRWFARGELATWPETIFPEDLTTILEQSDDQ